MKTKKNNEDEIYVYISKGVFRGGDMGVRIPPNDLILWYFTKL
jgi:hypothetical protein